MSREQIAKPNDFGDLAASLGITEKRREALSAHMEEKVKNLLAQPDGGQEVIESTSEKLVDFWNDGFFTPQEVLYACYTLGYVESQRELADMLGGAINAMKEKQESQTEGALKVKGNLPIL